MRGWRMRAAEEGSRHRVARRRGWTAASAHPPSAGHNSCRTRAHIRYGAQILNTHTRRLIEGASVRVFPFSCFPFLVFPDTTHAHRRQSHSRLQPDSTLAPPTCSMAASNRMAPYTGMPYTWHVVPTRVCVYVCV